MRLLLFTGNGGAGTSTIAAATAVLAARSGIKTLACALDPAPGRGPSGSLGACLGAALEARPTELEPGLSAVGADPLAQGEQWWQALQGGLPGLLDGLGVDPVPTRELTVLPGIEELLALQALPDHAVDGGFDLVVADCGPAARAIRLLASPEAVSRYLEQALSVERRVRRALELGARAGRSAGSAPPRDYLVEAAERLHAVLAGLRELLDAPQTSVRLVLSPDAAGVAQARQAATALALYGFPVDAVVANRLVPGDGEDTWRLARAGDQHAAVEQAERLFAPVTVRTVADELAEPVGVLALLALGEGLYGAPGPAAAQTLLGPSERPPATGEVIRDGEHFELCLPLAFADRRDLGLARSGDHLVLQLGGHRRVLALPSGLRRCVVVGARLAGGVLRVRFAPDPDLWPQ